MPRPTTWPQAKAAKVDTMDAQRPGTFDKKAFIAAVKAAIEAKSPKTLKEADDYKSSGKAGEVKGEVKGLVTAGQGRQAKDIETATEAAARPVQGRAEAGHADGPGAAGPEAPRPADGCGAQAGARRSSSTSPPANTQANQEMAEGEVTEPQLAQSNEPQFEEALAGKKAAAAHAEPPPGSPHSRRPRSSSRAKLTRPRKPPRASTACRAPRAQRWPSWLRTRARRREGRSEAGRGHGEDPGHLNATEADVKKILAGIDPKVENGVQRRASCRACHLRELCRGQDVGVQERSLRRLARRSALGEGQVIWDAGQGQRVLRRRPRAVPAADGQGDHPNRQHRRRRPDGGQEADRRRTEPDRCVRQEPPKDLKKVGADASKEIGERFDQLESEVDSKQESLVDTLASKYVEARKGFDDRIEELQAENKGLVDKAIGAIKAVINTIRELVAMLKNVLSRVAGVVGRDHQAPCRVPRQPDRGHQGRHPQVQGQLP